MKNYLEATQMINPTATRPTVRRISKQNIFFLALVYQRKGEKRKEELIGMQLVNQNIN
jgi:hypothetical protein